TPEGEGFRLEGIGGSYRRAELIRLLEEHPERFSTDVLLRPVVQDAVLPGDLYLGGPAEMAYFAQLRPVYEWFGLPPPRIALRLSATLIECQVGCSLGRLELRPGDPCAAARRPP